MKKIKELFQSKIIISFVIILINAIIIGWNVYSIKDFYGVLIEKLPNLCLIRILNIGAVIYFTMTAISDKSKKRKLIMLVPEIILLVTYLIDSIIKLFIFFDDFTLIYLIMSLIELFNIFYLVNIYYKKEKMRIFNKKMYLILNVIYSIIFLVMMIITGFNDLIEMIMVELLCIEIILKAIYFYYYPEIVKKDNERIKETQKIK